MKKFFQLIWDIITYLFKPAKKPKQGDAAGGGNSELPKTPQATK